MSLLESQTFFYDLCSQPQTIQRFKKNKSHTLNKYFSEKRDRQFLSQYPAERFQTYRNHISYGILGGIASCFPVLKSLINEKDWNDLLNDFYLKRLTKSPIARHVFGEFSHYLQKKYRGPLLKKFPYLKELAEYEFLDLKLFFEKEISFEKTSPRSDAHKIPKTPKNLNILSLKPILNPHLALRRYQWPVHQICKEYFKPSHVKKGKYGLVVYRDPGTFKVRFLEANEGLLKLIETLSKKLTVKQLCKKFHHLEHKVLFEALGFLKEKNVILHY